jgi:hypothetical protein
MATTPNIFARLIPAAETLPIGTTAIKRINLLNPPSTPIPDMYGYKMPRGLSRGFYNNTILFSKSIIPSHPEYGYPCNVQLYFLINYLVNNQVRTYLIEYKITTSKNNYYAVLEKLYDFPSGGTNPNIGLD